MTAPERGQVSFLGEDWQTVTPARAMRLRSTIGRMYGRNEWVSYLSVLDNILLPSLHHSSRPIREFMAESLELARHFACLDFPRQQPEVYRADDLHRAAAARVRLHAAPDPA